MDKQALPEPVAEELKLITIRYSRTGQDYVAANLAYLKANGWLKVIGFFIGVLLLGTFCRLGPILFDGFQLWDYILLGGFLLSILIILIAFFVNPFIVGNKLNKQNLWIAETVCTASEQTIRFVSEFGDDQVNWENYWKVIESGDAFILLSNANKQVMQIIPKRGFNSLADEQAFRELVQRKINLWAVVQSKKSSSMPGLSKRGVITLIVVGIFIILIVTSSLLQTSAYK